jgi:hypothetical protein
MPVAVTLLVFRRHIKLELGGSQPRFRWQLLKSRNRRFSTKVGVKIENTFYVEPTNSVG